MGRKRTPRGITTGCIIFLAEVDNYTVNRIQQQGIYREILAFKPQIARFHTATTAHIAGLLQIFPK